MKVILALTSVGVLLGGPAQAQNPPAICRASGLDEATAEARLSMLDELGKRVVAAGLKPFPTIVRE